MMVKSSAGFRRVFSFFRIGEGVWTVNVFAVFLTLNGDGAKMKVFVVYAVLCSLTFTLGFFWNPVWFLVPIVLGLNLIQSAFTDFCPLSRMVLGKGGGTGGKGAAGEKSGRKKKEKVASKKKI